MERDSLFGEPIIWSGRPAKVRAPLAFRVAAAAFAAIGVVMLTFAAVVARALHADVGSMIFWSGWCFAFSIGCFRLPIVWLEKVEYLLTERHVIVRRGRYRRMIDRAAISYARIRWDAKSPSLGDLELVRAVPSGALARRLTLTLSGILGPDRVWAAIRGVRVAAPLGSRDRPLAQRLDEGERVLWSSIPGAASWTWRHAMAIAVFAIAGVAFARALSRVLPALSRLASQHALSNGLFAALAFGVALGLLALLAVAGFAGYVALVRPIRLARATRYFVTDSRVLIQRGFEELCLDRARIAYVIDAPQTAARQTGRLHDVFLVLDGPRARAFAPGGAFGETPETEGDALRPVFSSIVDAERVSELLSDPALRKAA